MITLYVKKEKQQKHTHAKHKATKPTNQTNHKIPANNKPKKTQNAFGEGNKCEMCYIFSAGLN